MLPDSFQIQIEQVPLRWRDKLAQVAANHFVRLIAEEACRRRVDREQRPCEVLRADESLTMFHQMPITAFTRPERLGYPARARPVPDLVLPRDPPIPSVI